MAERPDFTLFPGPSPVAIHNNRDMSGQLQWVDLIFKTHF
jgi:hypothetical protein